MLFGHPPVMPLCGLVRPAGHKNAVLELHWTPDGEHIISCSPDRTVRSWDAQSGLQVKKMGEHTDIVNSCCPLRRGPPLLVSGSDDGTSKVGRNGAWFLAYCFSRSWRGAWAGTGLLVVLLEEEGANAGGRVHAALCQQRLCGLSIQSRALQRGQEGRRMEKMGEDTTSGRYGEDLRSLCLMPM